MEALFGWAPEYWESDGIRYEDKDLLFKSQDYLSKVNYNDFVYSRKDTKELVAIRKFHEQVNVYCFNHKTIPSCFLISAHDIESDLYAHVLIYDGMFVYEACENGHLEFGNSKRGVVFSDGEYNIPSATQFPEEILHILQRRYVQLQTGIEKAEPHWKKGYIRVYNYICNFRNNFDRHGRGDIHHLPLTHYYPFLSNI